MTSFLFVFYVGETEWARPLPKKHKKIKNILELMQLDLATV
jgi:hypothetical protein